MAQAADAMNADNEHDDDTPTAVATLRGISPPMESRMSR